MSFAKKDHVSLYKDNVDHIKRNSIDNWTKDLTCRGVYYMIRFQSRNVYTCNFSSKYKEVFVKYK